MTTSPLVSVVIPCYNAEAHLAECLESATSQDYARTEIIVVDDGSSDRSVEIASGFGGVRVVAQENAGAPAARNRGARLAEGEWIKFLDADDVLCPRALSAQVACLDGRLDAKTIGYGYYQILRDDEPGEVRRRIPEQVYDHPVVDLMYRNVLTSLPLYPIEAIRAVGGFDERLSFGQEWDLNLRLALKGYRYRCDEVQVYWYREHESGGRIGRRPITCEEIEQNLSCTEESVSAADDPAVRDAWAGQLWKCGRGLLVGGDRDGARRLFARARAYSEHYDRYFRPRYRRLAKWLGPFVAERISLWTNPEVRRIARNSRVKVSTTEGAAAK